VYIPEYSLTEKILQNVATTEYSKGCIDSTVIQQQWEKQLKKDADLRFIYTSLNELGFNYNFDSIKKIYDGYAQDHTEVLNLKYALDLIDKNSRLGEVNETILGDIQKILFTQNKDGMYRNVKTENSTDTEEILAAVVELFDWYNSYDAKQAHPLISTAILKVELEKIKPFEYMNSATINILVKYALKINGYDLGGYICMEDYYKKTADIYKRSVTTISDEVQDLTEWIQYFCEGFANEASNLKEKISLLGKDTKVAKAAGQVHLSEKQERIVEYLQDFGMLQNKDFPKLFPEISEDTILRNLKDLVLKGVVKKSGSTKSSKYELV
jgi:Fic family protein